VKTILTRRKFIESSAVLGASLGLFGFDGLVKELHSNNISYLEGAWDFLLGGPRISNVVKDKKRGCRTTISLFPRSENWEVPYDVILRWGETPSLSEKNSKSTSLKGATGKSYITIDDMDKDGIYFYKLFLTPESGKTKRLGPYRFKTPKSKGKEYKFVVIGDQHLYDDDVSSFPDSYYFVNDIYKSIKEGHSVNRYKNLRAFYVAYAIVLAQEEDPDFIIFLGDESGTGSVKYRYKRMGLKVGNYKLNTNILTERWMGANQEYFHSIPTFFVYGNHDLTDWLSPDLMDYAIDNMQKYFPQFIDRKVNGAPAGFTYPQKASHNEKWGAFRWGSVLYVFLYSQGCINGEEPEKPEDRKIGDRQYQYVERKVRNSKAPIKLLISHNTFTGGPYKSNCLEKGGAYGRGGKNYCDVGDEKLIYKLMKKYGPGIHRIYGHDHALAIGDAGNGIKYICGGTPSYQGQWLGRSGWRKMYKGDYWNGHQGILVGHVKSDSVIFEYKSTDPLGYTIYKSSKGDIPAVPFGETVKKFKIYPS